MTLSLSCACAPLPIPSDATASAAAISDLPTIVNPILASPAFSILSALHALGSAVESHRGGRTIVSGAAGQTWPYWQTARVT